MPPRAPHTTASLYPVEATAGLWGWGRSARSPWVLKDGDRPTTGQAAVANALLMLLPPLRATGHVHPTQRAHFGVLGAALPMRGLRMCGLLL